MFNSGRYIGSLNVKVRISSNRSNMKFKRMGGVVSGINSVTGTALTVARLPSVSIELSLIMSADSDINVSNSEVAMLVFLILLRSEPDNTILTTREFGLEITP